MPKAKFAARGRPKPKSVKAKVPLSSKRKLSRFGKKQKAGHEGSAVEYIARTRAVKKLQITLRDFRRLCILKGIYPREPRHLARGATQTYYHWKDISYLSHEPLLQKFREFKIFMKRVRKAMNRHDRAGARKMYLEQKPVYTLDHILKERYPRFEDALADLDDALSMLALFAGACCGSRGAGCDS
jgi:pescadillo